MSRTKHRAELLYRYLIIATKRLTDRQLMILLAIVVGLAAGLATYVFQHTLEFFRFSLTSWFDIDKASVLYFFYPVVGIVIATLFVRYVVRDDISEGVTRVLYAMSKKGSRIKPHNCYSSIIASSATIGFGGSVGPEAPIVLTGSAIGSNIRPIHADELQKQHAAAVLRRGRRAVGGSSRLRSRASPSSCSKS